MADFDYIIVEAGLAGCVLAVVDPLLRVHGIDRLRIADALVFPNITSANLNAPTTMLAHKAAQLILAAHIG